MKVERNDFLTTFMYMYASVMTPPKPKILDIGYAGNQATQDDKMAKAEAKRERQRQRNLRQLK